MKKHYIFITLMLFLLSTATPHSSLEKQIHTLNHEIKESPKEATLYIRRAELHRRHSNWNSALADYTLAEKYGYAKSKLLFYQSRMHFEAGALAKSLELINSLLSNHPEHTQAHLIRARINLRNVKQRLYDYNKSFATMDTMTPELYLERAALLSTAGSEYFDEMLLGLNQGIENLGPVITLLEFGITQCKKHKDYSCAISYLQKLPSILKNTPQWQYKHAQLLLSSKQFQKAKNKLHEALGTIEKLPIPRKEIPAIKN